MSAAFDTLRLVRTLRDKARFTAEQAEGMADAFAEALQGDIATKADVRAVKDDLKAEVRAVRDELKAVKDELKAQIRETELRLEAKMDAGRVDTLKWVIGTIGFQTIVLLGAALALSRVLAH